MADRSSANIFGTIFRHLAANPTPSNRAFAWQMWGLKEAAGCDFNDYQMDADSELVMLGLATTREDDDGWKEVLYPCDDDGPTRPESFEADPVEEPADILTHPVVVAALNAARMDTLLLDPKFVLRPWEADPDQSTGFGWVCKQRRVNLFGIEVVATGTADGTPMWSRRGVDDQPGTETDADEWLRANGYTLL